MAVDREDPEAMSGPLPHEVPSGIEMVSSVGSIGVPKHTLELKRQEVAASLILSREQRGMGHGHQDDKLHAWMHREDTKRLPLVSTKLIG